MDFAIPTVYVLSASNTLPTTGDTSNLAASQFGVFKPDGTPATAGNVASQTYFFFSQGRNVSLPGVGTKRSPNIKIGNKIEWYKVTAQPGYSNQITEISDFTAQCGETLTVSIRVTSLMHDISYFNGLTRSYTVVTPCCDCGADVCADVDDLALVQAVAAQMNNDRTINSYLVAEVIGGSGSAKLRISAKDLPAIPTKSDPTVNHNEFDRLYFGTWIYTGPETTQDYMVWDRCDQAGVVTVKQRATYPMGTYAQMKSIEMDNISYQVTPIAKEIYKDNNFNNTFTSELVAGTNYDYYYLKFATTERDGFADRLPIDYEVHILNPTGQNAGTIAVLTAAFGAPEDKAPNAVTTTTTTSTTSTSTTTTTTLIP